MSAYPFATLGERLPVALLTGFLGSGKTTLLNRLLRHPDMARTAVVINEYGAIGIDPLFVERSDGEVTVLTNGCLCCDVQGDLEGVIGTLFGQRDRGEVPSFDRMVIETTGLADPAPIMQMLLNQPLVVDNFRLDALITTVDAVHALRQLKEQPEATKQIALADRLVLTKSDLATDEQMQAVHEQLASINPRATRLFANTEPGPDDLFGVDHSQIIHDPQLLAPLHSHLHDIDSFSIQTDTVIDWQRFSRFLTQFRVSHADQLLRVKGVLNVHGESVPIAIHGVHHVFHPPIRLAGWPAGDSRLSRIVFITRGLPRSTVESAWHAHFDDTAGRMDARVTA